MNATATIDLQATAELVWERVVAWELQPLWMRPLMRRVDACLKIALGLP